jgi:hypothetical protein
MAGFYTNLNEDSERRTWGNYGANYRRLAEIKYRYDPGNLFRLNANVRPAQTQEEASARAISDNIDGAREDAVF